MTNLFEVKIKFPGQKKSIKIFIKTKKSTISYDMVDRGIKNLIKGKIGLDHNFDVYDMVNEIHTLVDKNRFNEEVDMFSRLDSFGVSKIYTITKICPTRIYIDKELNAKDCNFSQIY